ncbi:MAG: peroxiredoxin [Pseudomonadota bacterium]
MPKPLTVGSKLPNLTVTMTNEQKIKLASLKGNHVVLYFYPRDSTPGCTQEGKDFRDNYKAFTDLNAIILGVSRDSLSSHEKFKQKYEMPFDLIADPEEEMCQRFDVMKMKNMYGKQVRGIERSTFLIDDTGVIRQIWRKVKVPGHVCEVLASLKNL